MEVVKAVEASTEANSMEASMDATFKEVPAETFTEVSVKAAFM